MDESKDVISYIQADFADRRNSVLLPSIIEPLHQCLLAQKLPLREIPAETEYSNGIHYALLESRGITP